MKKIYVQSSTEIQSNPRYLNGIKEHSENILSPGYTIDIGGVNSKYSNDVDFMASEYMNNQEILQNLIKAEKDGYDAIALHCFLDPVLDEAREIINIPIVSMAESSMLMSLMYGKKFAIVTYSPQLAKKSFRNLIQKYGLTNHAVETQVFEVSMQDLGKALIDPGSILEQFMVACKKAVEQGAEVILPGCGLLNILCIQNNIAKEFESEATILDVTGVTLKMAETKIALKEVSGTTLSRVGYYKEPKPYQTSKLKENNLD